MSTRINHSSTRTFGGVFAALGTALALGIQLSAPDARAMTTVGIMDLGADAELGADTELAMGPGVPGLGKPPTAAGALCTPARVYFDGSCRDPQFFERFVTPGEEFVGVFGPNLVDASRDTGVVVVEEVSDDVLQYVYVLPDKAAPGTPRTIGTQYRANYPLAGIASFSNWTDSSNRMNSMATFYRRIPAGLGAPAKFGVAEWTHRAETASGYRINDSNGTSMLAQGLSSASDTCKAAGTAHGEFIAAACKATALVGSAAVGVAAGVAVGVLLSSASFGVGAPGAAAGGVAIGGGTFTVVAGTTVSICQNLGDALEAAHQARCPLVAAGTAVAPVIEPAATEEAADFSQSGCPAGQVKYTGEATYCTDGGNDTSVALSAADTVSEEIVVVDDGRTCTTFHASNQCVMVANFS